MFTEVCKIAKKKKVISSRDVLGSPGTKKSRDLTSLKVPELENWKSLGTIETLLLLVGLTMTCFSKKNDDFLLLHTWFHAKRNGF